VGSLNFMRLSLKKGAHAVLFRAAYRKFGVSARFWQMWDSEDLVEGSAFVNFDMLDQLIFRQWVGCDTGQR
jgi:hypothetical protein